MQHIKYIFYQWINRLMSIILLILLSPVFLIVSLLILIYDGRPIFYTQRRVGYKNKLFKIYKFRTMKPEAPKSDVPFIKKENDIRLTKLGKWLRKYSLDELPQLINIIKGDMNLIGVRPLIPEENCLLDRHRLKYHPGLTGPTQIYRDNILSIKEMNKLEEEFNNNYSFKTFIIIFFKTFKVLFKGI